MSNYSRLKPHVLVVRKQLKKCITFPFDQYSIRFIDDDTDEECSDFKDHVLYFDILGYSFYIYIPEMYPIQAPTVMCDIVHPLFHEEMMELCNWGPFITMPILLTNLYCIASEAEEMNVFE